jgi:DNA polymerase I-like protein with 3'-5' exonuclease and polymerase domains
VRTIIGRIREVANINSSDPVIAKRCERQAVNAVIQGSAADIVYQNKYTFIF